MDVYKPTQDDMIRAEEKLQARQDQLGVVSDSGETKTFLNEVVDKVSDVVDVVASCHDDTMSTKSEADPLLSYLDAEKKLCTTKRIEIAALRRRLVTRPGNDDSAAPPIDSELIRRIESIVSGAAAEYKECREEQYCAVLVRELTDVCVDAESWTESSTDARYAKRPTLLHRALLKAARLALSRLVEKQVRDGLGENNETGLPKALARWATLAVKMDVDGARNCLHVQDLLAKREKLAARVRTLQAQKKRLRRVRGNVEQSERLLANSVVAAAIDAQARQENATDAAVATTPVCLDQDPVATSVYRLCSQQVAAIAAKADQLDEMALRRQRANELVDRLEVDMIARCQGSTSKWLDDVRAAIPEKQNKNLLLKRALLIEFHENPQRFVARMKSATLLKKRGALPHITQKEDDAQHP
ncbi:hypothetical protein MRX96_008803 [Rhipicephalus microplus]